MRSLAACPCATLMSFSGDTLKIRAPVRLCDRFPLSACSIRCPRLLLFTLTKLTTMTLFRPCSCSRCVIVRVVLRPAWQVALLRSPELRKVLAPMLIAATVLARLTMRQLLDPSGILPRRVPRTLLLMLQRLNSGCLFGQRLTCLISLGRNRRLNLIVCLNTLCELTCIPLMPVCSRLWTLCSGSDSLLQMCLLVWVLVTWCLIVF